MSHNNPSPAATADTGLKKDPQCQNCNMSALCLPTGLSEYEIRQLDRLIGGTIKLKQKQHLFKKNTPFHALYTVRSGCIETYSLDADGNLQILGFHFAGDILGFSAIYSGAHTVHAIALEQSEVCTLPFDQIRELATHIPSLFAQLMKMMSKALSQNHSSIGHKSAEARTAAFLLDMAINIGKETHCKHTFRLPMSRKEIANYLQLAPETTSRVLSKFHELKLIEVSGRHFTLSNVKSLEKISNDCNP